MFHALSKVFPQKLDKATLSVMLNFNALLQFVPQEVEMKLKE